MRTEKLGKEYTGSFSIRYIYSENHTYAMNICRPLLVRSSGSLLIFVLLFAPISIFAQNENTQVLENTGFAAHGTEAFPSYAYPSYAYPSYAYPSYAYPSYAYPSYAFPSYAFMDGETQYFVSDWGLEKIFPTVDDENTLANEANHVKTYETLQIAVLDTGIYMHSNINNIVWTYDATGQNDMTDVSGHGTHVAGIISSFGIADIYAIKVMDGPEMTGEWSWLEAGIYAAIQGPDGIVGTADDADIINLSLGSGGENPPATIKSAIDTAYANNIAIVASAGNSGDGNVLTNDQVQYPAAYKNVIAVGATDVNDNIAPFSNTNDYVEVVAPGVDIVSTFKDNEYAIWSGTSMAAAYVSGLLGYLIYVLSQDGGSFTIGKETSMSENQLRGALHTSALNLQTSGDGYGLIQFLGSYYYSE